MAPPAPIMKATRAVEGDELQHRELTGASVGQLPSPPLSLSRVRPDRLAPLSLRTNGQTVPHHNLLAIHESFLPSAAASPCSPTFPQEAFAQARGQWTPPTPEAYYDVFYRHPYRIASSTSALPPQDYRPPQSRAAALGTSQLAHPPSSRLHAQITSHSLLNEHNHTYPEATSDSHIPILKRKLETLRIQGQAIRDEFKAAKRKLSMIKNEYEFLKGLLYRACIDKAVRVRERFGGPGGNTRADWRDREGLGTGGRRQSEGANQPCVGNSTTIVELSGVETSQTLLQPRLLLRRPMENSRGQKRKREDVDWPPAGVMDAHGLHSTGDRAVVQKAKKQRPNASLVRALHPHNLYPEAASSQSCSSPSCCSSRSYSPTPQADTGLKYSPAIQDSPFLDAAFPSPHSTTPVVYRSRQTSVVVLAPWAQEVKQLGSWNKHERTLQCVHTLACQHYETGMTGEYYGKSPA